MHRFLITSSDLLDKVIALYPPAQNSTSMRWRWISGSAGCWFCLVVNSNRESEPASLQRSLQLSLSNRAQCCVYSCRLFVLSMPFVLSHPPKSDNRIIFQSFKPWKKAFFLSFFCSICTWPLMLIWLHSGESRGVTHPLTGARWPDEQPRGFRC